MNRVVLIGRLTRDPELRTTSTGKSVCGFGIAVNKRIKPTDGSPDADFFNIVCWGQNAEYVDNYIHKGRLVAVDGRLQSRKYTTTGGDNREVIEIVADHVQALDRPKEEEARLSKPADLPPPPPIDEYDPFADE